ncbi:MAG TPA: hypothetical protein PKD26_01265 [Pyrinomonadaceae bacterium]|nr:hypothetical protein [Pyrinomonadaceae bacterium]
MNKLKWLVATSALSLLILGLPAIASAQWNGGYGNSGPYNSNYNLKPTVKNLKEKAKSFERSVDRMDDRWNDRRSGPWGQGNNSQSLRNLERLSTDFRKAADELEKRYGNGRNLNNSAPHARRVIDIAMQIDREINASRGRGNLQGQWNSMRHELNMVAHVYGYNPRGPGRNDRGGNWRNNFPFPLPF